MAENAYSRRRKTKGCGKPGCLPVIMFLALMLVVVIAATSLIEKLPQADVPSINVIPSDAQGLDARMQGGSAEVLAEESLWYLTLVNKWNPLPETYELTLDQVEGGESVDERIVGALTEMLDAAGREGLGPMVVSGYRSAEKQQRLLDDKIAEYRQQGYSQKEAERLAAQWVSAPGASEHQLGLAVDMSGDTYDIFFWLQENSYKYGFICRYPGEKIEITGVANEPWHYRYVGVEAATDIYEQGLCLEEYLGKAR